jgi:hypothetical protein
MGATWRFASAAHRDQFATKPAQYAPQYGGIVRTPSAKDTPPLPILKPGVSVEGKLYLDYSKGVQKTSAQDVSGNIPGPSGRINPAPGHFSSSSVIRAE